MLWILLRWAALALTSLQFTILKKKQLENVSTK